MADAVLTDSDGGIAVITINRPQARNAVNGEVARGIAAAVDEFDGAEDVRVIILTGAGGTFSAGMDLKAFLASGRLMVISMTPSPYSTVTASLMSPSPVGCL